MQPRRPSPHVQQGGARMSRERGPTPETHLAASTGRRALASYARVASEIIARPVDKCASHSNEKDNVSTHWLRLDRGTEFIYDDKQNHDGACTPIWYGAVATCCDIRWVSDVFHRVTFDTYVCVSHRSQFDS